MALIASPSAEQDRRHHLVLGAEVPVHERVVHAGRGGDLPHAHAVHAVRREQLARGGQDDLSRDRGISSRRTHTRLPEVTLAASYANARARASVETLGVARMVTLGYSHHG